MQLLPTFLLTVYINSLCIRSLHIASKSAEEHQRNSTAASSHVRHDQRATNDTVLALNVSRDLSSADTAVAVDESGRKTMGCEEPS